MPQRSWTLLGSRNVSDHKIFRLRHDLYRFEPSGIERDFVVLDTPSWVNVVPVTADGRVVLIRQYRHGIQDVTLEIPGGIIDDDEPPEAAAARELQEETGYAPSGCVSWLGCFRTPPFKTIGAICLSRTGVARRANSISIPWKESTCWSVCRKTLPP